MSTSTKEIVFPDGFFGVLQALPIKSKAHGMLMERASPSGTGLRTLTGTLQTMMLEMWLVIIIIATLKT